MSVDSVTIVMVPRERYSGLPQAIDSLYEKTAVPFKLIVVDGCLPKHIKEAVDLRASQYGFEFIYRDYPLLPNEARNIGIQLCQTRYIVFVDNDVRFSSNWLPPLLDSAEEFSAALVGPTIFDGTKEEGKIHAAGGKMWFDEVDGHRRYHMLPSHMQQQLSDVSDSLIRGPATMLEFHVLLARTDFFRQHGLLDEKLSTWADHDDLVLTATQAGLPVIYDPRSCVEYDDPGTSNNVLKLSDIPYFLLRWGEAVNESAINHASRKWGCDPNDPWIRHANEWIRYRRRKVCRMIGPGGRLLAFVLFRLNRKLGSRLERMLCGLATRKLDQKRSAALSPSLSKS